MKKSIIFIFITAILAISATAQNIQEQQLGPVTITGYKVVNLVKIDKSKYKYTATGPKLKLSTTDGTIISEAGKIIVVIVSGKDKNNIGSLQTAEFIGRVHVIIKDPVIKDKYTEIWADNATADWANTQQAVLTGNVKVLISDPDVFYKIENGKKIVVPSTLNGDKAVISLLPDDQLKPGEERIRIESNDENKSKLQFTFPPKNQASTGFGSKQEKNADKN